MLEICQLPFDMSITLLLILILFLISEYISYIFRKRKITMGQFCETFL